MRSQHHVPDPAEEERKQVILSSAGIMLPWLAGTMVWWVPAFWWGQNDISDEPTAVYVVAAVSILFAFVGAALLRSWWALLIIPVAWALGQIMYGLTVTWPVWQNVLHAVTLHVGLPVLILAMCSAPGVLFGQWMARRKTLKLPAHTA